MASYGLRFLAGCQRRYGNMFTLRIPLSGKVVYLADPADIKTVYAGDPHVFHSGEAHWFFRGLLGTALYLSLMRTNTTISGDC